MASGFYSWLQDVKDWWRDYQPDPRVDIDKIEAGPRKSLEAEGDAVVKYPGGVEQPISKSQRQTGACQYWIRGLPSVCSNWDGKKLKCTVDFSEDPKEEPTGYGLGYCDMLGRRNWCSKYEESSDFDPDEYVCVATCPEKSGLGKQITVSGTISGTVSSPDTLSFRPLLPSEVKGYNADEDGVGRCDGWGMGRGNQGPYKELSNIYLDPPICRHYRPNQMGFGAIMPHPFHGSEVPGPFKKDENWIPDTLKKLHDGSKADPLTKLAIRLPYVFQVYNMRAVGQKCAHWKNDTPAFFEVDDSGPDISSFSIIMDDVTHCDCDDETLCGPYKNETDDWAEGLTWILQSVWAPYGGIICNGAKPECPCYTGKWIYCTDNNMRDGMRVTANQIFELRFWASNWSSQDEYDAFYLEKPGTTKKGYADESTADIYTFTHWLKVDNEDPNDSVMVGNRHSMCMPAPLQLREFDPSIYIKKMQVKYPTSNEFFGTNIKDSDVSFPTLMRELPDPDSLIPDILVIYPYFSKDPWEVVPCDQNDQDNVCYHDTNLMTGTYISVVGHCLANKDMYVINSTLSEVDTDSSKLVKKYMDKYVRAMKIPGDKLSEFNSAMPTYIDECMEEDLGFSQGTTDDVGYFNIDSVELKVNQENTIYIICKYYSSDNSNAEWYTYRKFKVESRYWGALITQTQAIHENINEPTTNHFPEYFSPGVNIDGVVTPIRGEVESVFSTHATYHWGILEEIGYYSYCINEYVKEVNEVETWTTIGATGYIWAEIEDLDISYLFDFEIEKATLTYTGDPTSAKTKVNFCGANETNNEVEIELTVDFPTTKSERRMIPPNAVIFKTPTVTIDGKTTRKVLSFFNSDWSLYVKYKYKRLETNTINSETAYTVWPTGLNEDFGLNKFVASRYEVLHDSGENTFSIKGIGSYASRGSAKVMAYIVDENFRLQAAASTKMLLQGHEIGCRSVDIYYKYTADAIAYDLQPSTGFATWRGAPKVNAATTMGLVHMKKAPCGDHECNPSNCIGPMWFPFDACTTEHYYNVLNGAGQCTMPITEIKRATGQEISFSTLFKSTTDPAYWRYCTAMEYEAWVTPGGNWASACGLSFSYHYSRAEEAGMRFTGWANKKAPVDVEEYTAYNWVLPPFGNGGRGYVERYLTRDYISFIDFSTPEPTTRYEYVPMVFDKEDIVQDLNCFQYPDEYSPLNEPFSHFSILNNYLSTTMGESISKGRYRFEDIINIEHHGNCMYPYPLIPSYGGKYRVIRYGFKNNDHIWAWPDWWKPIERNLSSANESERFYFLNLIRPEYYFDYNKEEHRFITDEGEHTIIFEPPTGAESIDLGDDSRNSIYPSISIDGKYPRFFQIVYDDYSSGTVDWKDESTTGEEGASGGDSNTGGTEEGNIYELANTGKDSNGIQAGGSETQWGHDFDTLFDTSASEDPDDSRKIYLGKSEAGNDINVYYNTGLIADIQKSRLIYLPMEENTINESDFGSTPSGIYYKQWEIGEYGLAPVRVEVKGFYGMVGTKGSLSGNEEIYSKPGIEVRETIGDPPIWSESETVALNFSESGLSLAGESDLTEFTILFELPRTPDRFTKTWTYCMLKLTSTVGEKLRVTNLNLVLGKYTRAEEKIKVWERKYRVGFVELDVSNADGPFSGDYRTWDKDMKNAGQYFPFVDDFSHVNDPMVGVGNSFEMAGL
jgi:hypothetical protein